MPKDLRQEIIFDKATPHEVYEALMDSDKHAAFSGAPANLSREVGGRNEAYGGWVQSTNVELVQDKKIVQKWRGKDWPEDHYSVATFEMEPHNEGTKLVFAQTGIPDETYDHIVKGWKENYWDKMKSVLDN